MKLEASRSTATRVTRTGHTARAPMAQDRNTARPWGEKHLPLCHSPKTLLLPGLTPRAGESPRGKELPSSPGSLTSLA